MLLTDAKGVFVGDTSAKAVYVGSIQVWPSAPTGFDPESIEGLRIWFDAANYTPGSWPNKAATGASSTIVGSPVPAVSANQLNGLPLVRFTVNEGRLRILSGTGINQAWTLVYVGRIVGPYTGRVVDAVYPPNNLLVGYWNGFQDVCYDNGFTNPNTQTAVTNDWKLYSGDGAPGLTRMFSNGVLLGSTGTSAGWGESFSLSGYSAGGIEETCDCEIAEVLLYYRTLSDAERQQVEGYLRTKWNLT